MLILAGYGFKREFEAYLEHIEDSKIHSLEDLIQFNKDNAETELPPRESFNCRQQGMKANWC